MTTIDPSRPLTAAKQERFAQLLSQGLGVRQSYETAGYRYGRHGARNASRTKRRLWPRVEFLLQQRISNEEKANARAIARTALDNEWVLSRLVEVFNRCMQTFRPREATRALELIGKALHMFVSHHDHTHIVQRFEAMTPAERIADARALVSLMRERAAEYRRQEQDEGNASVIEGEAVVVPTDGDIGNGCRADKSQSLGRGGIRIDDSPGRTASLLDEVDVPLPPLLKERR